jgi:hypothetical protein
MCQFINRNNVYGSKVVHIIKYYYQLLYLAILCHERKKKTFGGQ